MGYTNHQTNTEKSHGSRNHVNVRDIVKVTFRLDIQPTDKTRSTITKVGKAFVKKKGTNV